MPTGAQWPRPCPRLPACPSSAACGGLSLARPGHIPSTAQHPPGCHSMACRRVRTDAVPGAILQERRDEPTRAANAANPRGDPQMSTAAAARGRRVAGGLSPEAFGANGLARGLPLPAPATQVLLGGKQPVGITVGSQRNRPRRRRVALARAAEARRGEGADLRPRSRGQGSPEARACHRAPAAPGDAPMGVWIPVTGWVPDCRSDLGRGPGQAIPGRPSALSAGRGRAGRPCGTWPRSNHGDRRTRRAR